MVSGDLDKLADAHHCAQYAYGFSVSVQKLTWQNGRVRYAAPFEGYAALENYVTNYEYTTLPETTSPPGWPWGLSEWYSGFHADLYICYCLSAWPQALGTLVPYWLRNLTGPGGFGFPTASYDASVYGGRFDFRLNREAETYYAMLNLPMDLRWDTYWTVIAPSVRTHRPEYLNYLQAKCFDSLEAWSLRFPSDYYLHGVWGTAPTFGTGVSDAGTYPTSQAIPASNPFRLPPPTLTPNAGVPNRLVPSRRIRPAKRPGLAPRGGAGAPCTRCPT